MQQTFFEISHLPHPDSRCFVRGFQRQAFSEISYPQIFGLFIICNLFRYMTCFFILFYFIFCEAA